MKPFQSKRCLFFDENEQTAFLECYSDSMAQLTIQCARMSMNSKYREPPMGWDKDVLELAKRLKGKKIVVDRLSYLNSYYLKSKKSRK